MAGAANWSCGTSPRAASGSGRSAIAASWRRSPSRPTAGPWPPAAADRTVRLWDVATGHPRATLGGHEGFVASVAFSPDGQWIASGGEDTLSGLWDLNARHLAGAPARPSVVATPAEAIDPARHAALDPSDADLMLTYDTSVSLSPARRPRSLPDGDRPPGAGGRPKL